MASRRIRAPRSRLVVGTLMGAAIAGGYNMSPAAADPVADFYKDRTVTLMVGASEGGAYAIYARMLARHMARHVPGNPTIIVQAMPGAGGTRMANYMYNVAPKDGVMFGTPLAPVPITQMLRPKQVKYDAAKFSWIGNLEGSPPVLAVWHTSPVQTIEQAKTSELIVASSGKGAVTYQVPALINYLLGTKMKIVTGYKGETDMDVALQRGEVHGRSSFYGSLLVNKAREIEEGKLRIIAQISTNVPAVLKDVPNIAATAEDPDARRMFEFFALQSATGRSYFLPPGVPKDRVDALRTAFDEATASAEFDTEMKRRRLNYDVTPGTEVQAAVENLLSTPEHLVARVRQAVGF